MILRDSWRFEIAGKSGKDVKNLSKYPSEDEVLYLPGTTFNVISSSGVHAGKRRPAQMSPLLSFLRKSDERLGRR